MTETLGFLISDVARLMRKRFDERARSIGATRAQWQALTKISRHEGINQGGLADILEVEPITLARMIDRLEESGLVERRRDPADRRAWRIHLTEKSRPLLAQLRVIADDLIENMLAGVPAADRDRLADTLEAIHLNLNTLNESLEAANG
jgi:MarR family transcriptional regulator, transcriptional regulator for hemolysin